MKEIRRNIDITAWDLRFENTNNVINQDDNALAIYIRVAPQTIEG